MIKIPNWVKPIALTLGIGYVCLQAINFFNIGGESDPNRFRTLNPLIGYTDVRKDSEGCYIMNEIPHLFAGFTISYDGISEDPDGEIDAIRIFPSTGKESYSIKRDGNETFFTEKEQKLAKIIEEHQV